MGLFDIFGSAAKPKLPGEDRNFIKLQQNFAGTRATAAAEGQDRVNAAAGQVAVDPRFQAVNMPGYGSILGAGQANIGAANPAQALAAQQATAMGVGGAGQVAGVNQQQQLGSYGNDLGLVRAAAQGQGPSVAQHLAQQQLDQGIQNQAAMAAQARGGNLAGALRGAAQSGEQMTLQSQAQMGALRAQEQLQAQQALLAGQGQFSGALAQARGQDVGQAVAFNQAQTGVTQGQLALQGQGLGATQAAAGLYNQGQQMGLQAGAQGFQQQLQAGQLASQNYGTSLGVPTAALGANAGLAAQGSQFQGQVVGGLISGGAAALPLLASDRRTKTNIEDGTKDVEELLAKVRPYSYDYKEPDKPGRAPGRQLSPMAQDLQKSKVGKSMVVRGPDGTLMVDYARGFGAMLVAQAALNAKVKRLEASK